MEPLNFLLWVLAAQLTLYATYISCSAENLLVVSVATEETDGYKRFIRSLKIYDYNYEIYGLGEEWKGGDVKLNTGGGQKINILKRELEKYKSDEDKVILFSDSYDVIINQSPSEVLSKFKNSGARIIFGTEEFCWPDPSLGDDYPPVGPNEKRFLNSGGLIAYATDLYEILTLSEIKDDDDDQLYYTKIFINKPTRDRYKMKLDTKSDIFQNLNGAINEIALVSMNNELVIYNNLTQTFPTVIHANGPTKIFPKLILNRLGNYIAKAYLNPDGCKICTEDTITLNIENRDEWPEVTLGIFVEVPTPFLREFFKKISNLNYPKQKLTVLIHNNVPYHTKEIESFFKDPQNEYYSIKYISPEDDSPEHEARTEAIQECKKNKCKYYFSVDSTAHLDNADTLKILIEQNRDVLSPIMIRKDSTWSNVWGAVSEKGFYQRSEDYLDLIYRNYFGVFNLPYVSEAILIKGELLNRVQVTYEDTFLDPSLKFSEHLRDQGVFLFATNMHYFGHLVNPDSFNITLIRPEMYEIFSNYDDWIGRYVREDYFDYLEDRTQALQPCPDVFWFPIVTDEFCEDLVTMMEHFGKWSGGRNYSYDERLPGGYENVPTVDIHMRQVDWQLHWLHFLKKIIQPMQQKIFIGYYHDPPEALLSFVVRYRPGEQDFLRPHHDASTYTLNIALNKHDADYEGGGCRFVRYNCSVLDTRKGWGMIHPGRLTHYHEGLKVTNGTRYIMVSFVDP